MTRMFRGSVIPGLVEAQLEVLRRQKGPMEFDVMVRDVGLAGFSGPLVRDHLEWLSVNDPRVVRDRKVIRRYSGRVDEA